jgi:hypothetical protein
MKKEELPQDDSALSKYTRELCYVKNEDGTYTTGLSKGWQVKKEALENAWDDIHQRVEDAKNAVKNNEKSPIYYFMELKLMDLQILSAYTNIWKFNIKRHLQPAVFKKLSESKLQKYAQAFEISVDELKNFNGE